MRDARVFFPGLDDKVFLDAATVGLAPTQAREAIERSVAHHNGLDCASAPRSLRWA